MRATVWRLPRRASCSTGTATPPGSSTIMSTHAFSNLRLIGKGTYGRVFKGTRRSDGNIYAVKSVDISQMDRLERRETVNEVRILASVTHPNIIRFCETFIEDDSLYIVTEFANNGDLSERLKRKEMSEVRIWSIFIQICQGLKVLHDQDIMHRDLKPQNIFLTDKNHIKIGDLGCCKLMRNSLCQTQIGTPYYMSPEVWRNRPYGKKSDMWALGCILYQMVMRQPPFLGRNIQSLSKNIINSPSPNVPHGRCSAELSNLISLLLRKSPRGRPSVNAVLNMPCIKSRLDFVQPYTSVSDDVQIGFDLVKTIRVPKSVSKLSACLPAPSYEQNKHILPRGALPDTPALNQIKQNRRRSRSNAALKSVCRNLMEEAICVLGGPDTHPDKGSTGLTGLATKKAPLLPRLKRTPKSQAPLQHTPSPIPPPRQRLPKPTRGRLSQLPQRQRQRQQEAQEREQRQQRVYDDLLRDMLVPEGGPRRPQPSAAAVRIARLHEGRPVYQAPRQRKPALLPRLYGRHARLR